MITQIKAVCWCFVISVALVTCSKENVSHPYSYVNLRVEGKEEDIWWDAVTGQWAGSSGALEMDCQGILFDQFRLRLKDILSTGDVPGITMDNIYYTDGLDFRPTAILSGYVRIVERDSCCIRGEYKIYFENDYNGVTSKTVSGDFGVVGN